MRCVAGFLLLLLAAGCVANNNYVHDTDNQDAQTQASYEQAALNARREAAMGALMGQMNAMSRNMNANQQSTAPTVSIRGNNVPSSHGAPAFDQLMAQMTQQTPAGQQEWLKSLEQLGPEVQLVADFVQALQKGDMTRATTLIRDASQKLVNDPKQQAVIEQMTQLVEAVTNKQGMPQGIEAPGGFTAPGRTAGGFTTPAASSSGGFSTPSGSSSGGFTPPTSSSSGGFTPPTSSSSGGFTLPAPSSSGGFTEPATTSSGGFTAPPTSSSHGSGTATSGENSIGQAPPPTSTWNPRFTASKETDSSQAPARSGSGGATFEVGPSTRDVSAEGKLLIFEPVNQRTYQDLELAVEARTDDLPAGVYQLIIRINNRWERALWCRVEQDGGSAVFEGSVPVPMGSSELCAWIPELNSIDPQRLTIHMAEKPTGFQEERLFQDLERSVTRARAKLDLADEETRPHCLTALVQALQKQAEQHQRLCQATAARLLHEEALALLEKGSTEHQQAEINVARALYLDGDAEALLDLMTRHAEQARALEDFSAEAHAYGLLAEWLLVLGAGPSEVRPYYDKAQGCATSRNCRILFND